MKQLQTLTALNQQTVLGEVSAGKLLKRACYLISNNKFTTPSTTYQRGGGGFLITSLRSRLLLASNTQRT